MNLTNIFQVFHLNCTMVKYYFKFCECVKCVHFSIMLLLFFLLQFTIHILINFQFNAIIYKKSRVFFISFDIFVESIDLIEYCNNNTNQISKQLEFEREKNVQIYFGSI